jgi:hypothetical protein
MCRQYSHALGEAFVFILVSAGLTIFVPRQARVLNPVMLVAYLYQTWLCRLCGKYGNPNCSALLRHVCKVHRTATQIHRNRLRR